jgi:hypothetical protein
MPPRWLRKCCAIWVSLTIFCASELHGQDSRVGGDVIKAWQEYDDFAVRLCGYEIRTTTNQITGKVSVKKYEYRQNKAGVLLRLYPVENEREVETVLVQNDRYCFETLTARTDPKRYVLRIYHRAPKSVLPSSAQSVRESVFIEFNPHYSFGLRRLWKTFEEASGVKARNAGRVATPTGERYRIDFAGKYTIPNTSDYCTVNGHLLLIPDRNYCIEREEYHEETFLSGKKSSERDYTVTFQTVLHPSGFPLLSRQECRLTGYSLRSQRKMQVSTDVEYQVGVSDDDDGSPFLLSAFGLPEPVDVAAGKKTARYVWFLIAAGFLVVFAILFRILARRKAITKVPA